MTATPTRTSNGTVFVDGGDLAGANARAMGRAPSRARWPTFIATAFAALYVAGAAAGWATNAADGYFGISRADTVGAERSRLAIAAVESGSPADRAGLSPADVILAVDGEQRVAGSRARWAGTGAAPTFQTRPLAVPNGDAPIFRRTTGDRKPGDKLSLRVQSAEPSSSTATREVTLVADSRLGSREVVIGLITWQLVALITLLAGIFVVLRRPADIAARLLLATTACFAFALVLLSWDNRPLPDGIAFVAQLATSLLAVAGSAFLLHLWLVFPARHRLLLRLARVGPDALAPVGRATILLYVVPLAAAAGLYLGPASLWTWPYLIAIALIAMALLALARSMLRPPTPEARAQLKWIAAPLVANVVVLALGPGITATTGALSEVLSATITVAVWALFPIGVGVSVLRYRLFDVDLVLRAATVYPLLAALLAGAYLAAAQALAGLALSFFGSAASGNPAVPAGAALLVAAGAHPLYVRLQAGMDRLIYRERITRQRLLEDAMALRGQSPYDDATSFLTRDVVQRLDLAVAWLVLPTGVIGSRDWVGSTLLLAAEPLLARMQEARQPALLLKQEDLAMGGSNALCAGDPALGPWHAAGARLLLTLRGASAAPNSADGLLGVWLLGARRSGSLLDTEDVTALGHIARRMAVLLDNDRLRRQEAAEKERTARFRQYFSPQIADLIAGQGGELATHRRELTVLSAELRGFSALGEIVEPEELVQHLSHYVDTITAVIFEHGGTVDKCVGDTVTAFFGDPLPQPDHATRALQAARVMQRSLDELKKGWAIGAAQVELAIGIATGWVTAGTIGSPARSEYAVIGHAVTAAARLAAKAPSGEILVTEKTRPLLGDFATSPRGEVSVEGRHRPIPVFGFSARRDEIADASEPSAVGDRGRGDSAAVASDLLADAELLARTALFASLPPDDIRRLAGRLRHHRFNKGATIVGAREASSSFFLIRSGTVKVTRALATGDEAVINVLGRGEFFGELALLEGQSTGSTVVALQPTEILVLSRDVFLDCLRAHPSTVSAAIGLLSERIRRLSDQLEEAYAMELPQRLARRLLALGTIHGRKTDEGLVIDLALTQSELAGMVGASRQRVNRVLAEWQDRRLLRLGSYGRITLLSPDTFNDVSGEALVS